MVQILLGRKPPGEVFQQSGPPGFPLYLDEKAKLLWICLPKDCNADYAAWPLTDPPLYLGSLSPIRTDGCLAFVELEPDPIETIERVTHAESLTSAPPPLPETIRPSQSLHEYVATADPNRDVLWSIAWYASTRIGEIRGNLTRALQGLTFEDLLKNHPAYVRRPIARSQYLFEELRHAVETRRLVFIVGGAKTGLSSFLDQFTSTLAAAEPRAAYVSTADFNPDVFKDIQSYLRSINQRGLVARLGCDSEVASLFIALAYAAYKSLLKSAGVDYTKLAAFVPMTAAVHSDDFAIQYISRSARHTTRTGETGSGGSQVESFLLFLGELMAAAGRAATLTVILSFPGLTNWLRENRGEDMAMRVSRALWQELTSFTQANYDADTGKPKPKSVMDEYKHNVGVVVEMQRLSFAEISEAFCKQSVLIMPPMNDDEVTTLWQQRVRTAPSQRLLDLVRHQTGGAPWFVDFLLDCFEGVWPISGGTTEDQIFKRLEAAAELAKSIVLSQAGGTTRERDHDLMQRWTLYVEDLASRMSAQTRTDRTTLLGLMSASGMKAFKMPRNVPASEWLESGLVWLRHPTRKHTLTALALYPFVHTFPQAELISLLIRSLTTPQARMEKVS